MSNSKWEHGTIIIPSKEWSSFRKGLLTKWNEHQLTIFADAQAAYKVVHTAVKGKHGEDLQKTLYESWMGYLEDYREACGMPYGHQDIVSNLLFKTNWNGEVALKRPKKSDLDTKPVSRGCTVNLGDAGVVFNNDTRSVVWDVPRSYKSARSHWFARTLFETLDRITWTRKSGGRILGDDTENYSKGGDKYVTAEYGVGPVDHKQENPSDQNQA